MTLASAPRPQLAFAEREYTRAAPLSQREVGSLPYVAANTRLASDSSIVVEASAGSVSMSC